MKSILITIKPRFCAKIMNGDKTIEIRKSKALANAIKKLIIINKKGYADIYVCCTKDTNLLHKNCADIYWVEDKNFRKKIKQLGLQTQPILNGKVLFKFRCYRVEEMRPFFHWCIEKETCLTRDEVLDYLDSKDKSVGNPKRQSKVYAIPINDLEIFAEPKELSEFKTFNTYDLGDLHNCHLSLNKAPQNFCYIEVEGGDVKKEEK